jgi:hypothetical protein
VIYKKMIPSDFSFIYRIVFFPFYHLEITKLEIKYCMEIAFSIYCLVDGKLKIFRLNP